MKTEKKQKINIVAIKEAIISVACIIIMSALICGLTYLLNLPMAEIIRTTITFSSGALMVLFLWYHGLLKGTLEYDNNKHQLRFFMVYIICYAVSVGMIFLPSSSWVFLSIMVVLAMFSNTVIGLTTGSVLLLTTVSLAENGNMYIFFMYFMIGLIGVVMFHKMDLDFKITGPLFLSGLGSFVIQTAYLVIFENQTLHFEIILMPLLNLFINMVLLFLILKYFSKLSMYLIQDKYSDINDQEFPLMVELKNNDKDLYFEAIHTAYLGERIAKKLKINDKAVKGCCYYFKLSKETRKLEDGTEILLTEYYNFPNDLKLLIEECQNGVYGSKESCVVLTANHTICSVQKAQKEFGAKKVPYKEIISQIFDDMIYSNMLIQCDISIKDLRIMEKSFIEEELYYDFLCRE